MRSKFQKRHYDAIADCIADSGLHTNSAEAIAQSAVIKDRLAAMFARDNKRFNRERFMRACQWQPQRLAA